MALVLAMVLVAADAAAQDGPQMPAEPLATLRGRVVSTVDGTPVPKAQVRMLGDAKGERKVMTDAKGEFEFTEVSGRVSLGARKPDFLCKQNGKREESCVQSVEIESEPAEVTLKLMPQAVITGVVRNEAGEPVKGLAVSHLRQELGSTSLHEWQRLPPVTTNEEGMYRIVGLEPGAYVIQTGNAADPDEAHPSPNLTVTTVDHGYAATYYPKAKDQESATPIVIGAGETVTANFTLKSVKFQLVTISYSGQKADGNPGLNFWGTEPNGGLEIVADTQNHAFQLRAPPGHFKLEAIFWPPADAKAGDPVPWKDGSTKPYYGAVEVTVTDAPITIADIAAQQPITIPIHVQTAFTQQDKVKAALGQYDTYVPPRGSFHLTGENNQTNVMGWDQRNPEKALQFTDVLPGKYAVGAYGSDGVYAASLTCGKQDLLREQLVVEPGTPKCSIEAMLRDDSASLDVGLTEESKAKLTATGQNVTTLFLIPLDGSVELAHTEGLFAGPAPTELKGISPGKYLVVASSNVESRAYRDAEVRKKLMTEGVVVTLGAGERRSILVGWVVGQ